MNSFHYLMLIALFAFVIGAGVGTGIIIGKAILG